MTLFPTWVPELKSVASYKQLEGVKGCLIHAIWMIKPTTLSSTFTIDEMWPHYIRVTITLLYRVSLLLIILWQISEESKPCLEVTLPIISSKRPLGNLLTQGRELFFKAYLILILLWTLTRRNSVSYLDAIELPTERPPFCLLSSSLSLSCSFSFDTKWHSSSSFNKLDHCSCITLLTISRDMVEQTRFASSRYLLTSPWGNLPFYLF